MSVVDAIERQQAIDCHQSFIVQAPAGSGKTELLTQRFLNLLAHAARQPEEILAITFTKKAAAEMRARIVESLEKAAHSACPNEEPARTNWLLAQSVLQRDEAERWCLRRNPNRLKIRTIDGFCSALVQQMPIVSQQGSVPNIDEDASVQYSVAASETLKLLESPSAYSDAIKSLLAHMDNDFNLVRDLLAGMLAKRDQWLTAVTAPAIQLQDDSAQLRIELESGLRFAIEDHLTSTSEALHAYLTEKGELSLFCELLNFSASQSAADTELASCLNRTDPAALPECTVTDLPFWCAIARWLLTGAGQWRSRLTKDNGFPAPSASKNAAEKALFKERKVAMTELCQQFKADGEDIRILLEDILRLPTAHYDESQWAVLASLLKVLPVAAAMLKLEFQQQGKVDFVEVAQGALLALSVAEADQSDLALPSELALKLDYQIQHLLIDEFQDTSITQYKLIEVLLSGWEPDDGRTLFLVGDPMQSIYRFRQADVSLFLKAREEGIQNVQLNSLVLKTNFRSMPAIVNWNNTAFERIFPAVDQLEYGGVSYSASMPGKADAETQWDLAGAGLQFYFDDEAQVAAIIKHIKRLREHRPGESIAVLVRTRRHAETLTTELQAQSLPVTAIEMQSMAQQPVIQDLLALSRALLDLSDRIAWLAVLRAPWCGATLADLWALSRLQPGESIFACLQAVNQVDDLPFESESMAPRLKRLAEVFSVKLAHLDRFELRHWVESTWVALDGPTYCGEQAQLLAERYFELLEAQQQSGSIDVTQLEQALAMLKANQISHDASAIEIMTVHKSKGLEFDHVIIPSIEKAGRLDQAELLNWNQSTRLHGADDYLVMAPISGKSEDRCAISGYISHLNKRKSVYEGERLFYVAATRAKKSLHCFGMLGGNSDSGVLRKPAQRSFLEALDRADLLNWEALQEQFASWSGLASGLSADSSEQAIAETTVPLNRLRRLQQFSCDVAVSTAVAAETDTAGSITALRKHRSLREAGGTAASMAGTLLHEFMAQIANRWCRSDKSPATLEKLGASVNLGMIIALLVQRGLTQLEAERQANYIHQSIKNALSDDRGRWILTQTEESGVEVALNYQPESAQAPARCVIDRTFVDEKDVRWIVDYKLPQVIGAGSVDPASIKAQYQQQLETYGKVMADMDNRCIKLGVYLPYQKLWVEWSLNKEGL